MDDAYEFFFLSQLRFLKLDIETSPRCSCCPPNFQYPNIRHGLEFFISVLSAAKIRCQRALRQIVNSDRNVINEATVRALDTLVIADCPVTRFGWIKSRVRDLRYVKKPVWGDAYDVSNSDDSMLKDDGDDDDDDDNDEEVWDSESLPELPYL